VILTGSVARREASIIRAGDRWAMLGDVEGVLVLNQSMRLLQAAEISRLCAQIRQELCRHGIDTDVSLAVVHEDFLRNQPAHIFSYELRNCGRVLWGEPNILRLIPEYAASDLSREDAWRMLSNRIIELLEYATELADGGGQYSFALQYRAAKLYLDVATSLLIFLNAYAPTYAGRAANLDSLSAQPDLATPFPMAEFAESVRNCTEYKLSPDGRTIPCSIIHHATSYACKLWCWELQRMTGLDGNAPALVRALAAKQTVQQRVRGWAFVVRHEGWFRSWRQWLRWMRIAVRYTPRYAVYLAGFQLLHAVSESAAARGTGVNVGTAALLKAILPAVLQGDGVGGWEALSRLVLQNYKLFVRDTRA
jgi:hypothetical protein